MRREQQWQTVRLGDVVKIDRNGVNPVVTDPTTPYLGLEHIDSEGSVTAYSSVGTGAIRSTKFRFDSRHVLFGKLRPYLRKITRPSRAGICSTDILPLLPSQLIDRDFLYHLLRTDRIVEKATSACAGANLPRLSPTKFQSFEIPLPPLPEQRRIAAILDKADAIRRKRRETIRLLDDFLRSVFLDMFGDPVTNPKGWPTKRLSDVGMLDRGISKHRPRNAPELLEGDHPLIQTGDVANSGGYIRHHTQTYSDEGLKQSKMWPSGTLCITIAANIAKTGILTFDACFPDSVVGFTPVPNRTTTEFVQHWLSFLQRGLEESAPESAQKNINLKILRSLEMIAPPVDLQERFSATVRNVENARLRFCDSGELLCEACCSLSQSAFKGGL